MKTSITRTGLVVASLLLAAAPLSAAVYTWKGSDGRTNYSDSPPQLRAERTATMNVRTHQVYQPESAVAAAPLSETEQLNSKIEEANKQIEAQNQKIEEENRQRMQENYQAARLNRQYAESARVANRDALVNRYNSDVNKFCN